MVGRVVEEGRRSRGRGMEWTEWTESGWRRGDRVQPMSPWGGLTADADAGGVNAVADADAEAKAEADA